MEKLVTISEVECSKRWGLGMYVYLFYNLVIFDKGVKEISLDADAALRFDLLYGLRGENC